MVYAKKFYTSIFYARFIEEGELSIQQKTELLLQNGSYRVLNIAISAISVRKAHTGRDVICMTN